MWNFFKLRTQSLRFFICWWCSIDSDDLFLSFCRIKDVFTSHSSILLKLSTFTVVLYTEFPKNSSKDLRITAPVATSGPTLSPFFRDIYDDRTFRSATWMFVNFLESSLHVILHVKISPTMIINNYGSAEMKITIVIKKHLQFYFENVHRARLILFLDDEFIKSKQKIKYLPNENDWR